MRAFFSNTRNTEEIMRLDKYLKVSRIIKRRTVANDACDAARITVNGKPAKASYQVKIGDVIEEGAAEIYRVLEEDAAMASERGAEE